MLATAIYGVLSVCVVALVAVGGLVAVQRLVPAARRQEHNDVAGFICIIWQWTRMVIRDKPR